MAEVERKHNFADSGLKIKCCGWRFKNFSNFSAEKNQFLPNLKFKKNLIKDFSLGLIWGSMSPR